MEGLLQGCGADMAAWWYVKRMRRLNLTGRQQQGGGAGSVADGLGGFGGAAQSQLTNLLGTTFGQGLSSLTKGAPSPLFAPGIAQGARRPPLLFCPRNRTARHAGCCPPLPSRGLPAGSGAP